MLSARFQLLVEGALSKLAGTGNEVGDDFRHALSIEYQDGSGAGQASKVWASRRVIAAGANDDIDLSGALENDLGDAVVFAAVKAVAVIHRAGASNAVVGNAGSNQFVGWFGAAAHTLAVPPGGAFGIARQDAGGWAVGAGATDILRINNPGGAQISVDVVIIGH